MANAIDVNPVFIDTEAVIVTAQHATIKVISWDGMANGDTVLIHDAAAGNLIFKATWLTGDPATSHFTYPGGLDVPGIYVTTLDGGTLLITLA